jgi:hypothetical protein
MPTVEPLHIRKTCHEFALSCSAQAEISITLNNSFIEKRMIFVKDTPPEVATSQRAVCARVRVCRSWAFRTRASPWFPRTESATAMTRARRLPGTYLTKSSLSACIRSPARRRTELRASYASGPSRDTNVRFFGLHEEGRMRRVCRKRVVTFVLPATLIKSALAQRTAVAYDPRTSRLRGSKTQRYSNTFVLTRLYCSHLPCNVTFCLGKYARYFRVLL